MKKIRRLFILLLAVVSVACSPLMPSTQPIVSAPVEPIVETPTISSHPTELPHETATMPSTLPADSSKQCFGSEQNLPVSIDGEFVLSGDYYLYRPGLELQHSPSFIWIPDTKDRTVLPQKSGDEIRDFTVSPNKKWLAYYTQQSGSSGQVIIIGNDGKLFKKFQRGDLWSVAGWIDDSHLLISKFSKNNPFPTIIFDPFGGKEETILPTYPDIYTGLPWIYWDRYASSETVYNSDLSLVIYPTSTTVKDPTRQIVLWDTKAGKALNKISDPWISSSTPVWLANGREFIIDVSLTRDFNHPDQEELMKVGADGSVKRLTHLLDSYENVQINSLSQSTDGRYIAFWLIPRSGAFQLAIYDMTTEKTTISCVKSISAFPLIWSPIGDQLLAAGFFDTVDNYGTVYVDVEKGLLAQVEKAVIPVGWMINP